MSLIAKIRRESLLQNKLLTQIAEMSLIIQDNQLEISKKGHSK